MRTGIRYPISEYIHDKFIPLTPPPNAARPPPSWPRLRAALGKGAYFQTA